MKILAFLGLFSLSFTTYSQVWLKDFTTEANGATSGPAHSYFLWATNVAFTDNTIPVAGTVLLEGIIRSGRLQAQE